MYFYRMQYPSARILLCCALALFVFVMFQGAAQAAQPKQKTFETPEAAVEALVKALRDHNKKELVALFGPGSETLISSGDKVDDRERGEEFVRLYDDANHLEPAGDEKRIVHVGKNDWPFPIPIVKVGESWRFDTKQGKEEILHRRIGENEFRDAPTLLRLAGCATRPVVAAMLRHRRNLATAPATVADHSPNDSSESRWRDASNR